MLAFVVATPLMAGCLWVGMKLTRVEGTVYGMLVIAAVANALLIVALSVSPAFFGLGAAVATLVTLVLIVKLTDARFWPDAVLVWLVAALVSGVLSQLLF